MRLVFGFLASVALASGCSGGSDPENGGDGDGDGDGDVTTTGGASTGGGAVTGGTTTGTGGADGATGGSVAGTGGSETGTGGSAPTAPIQCSPDISERMVPCGGTPAEVPSRTREFSVPGPFSAGETVAVSLKLATRSGGTVQAFAEPSSCGDSMTMISEVQIPNADYSCVEVTVTEAAQSVQFAISDDALTYPTLYGVCGACP